MVQSLEKYIEQATSAYAPATSAIQAQLSGLESQLNTTNENINRQYEQQQQQLNLARNQAAENASLQAAGSGGSFGGAANIANRKYYENTFVPAVTQMQTNQANALSSAQQYINDQRASLNSQLANLQAQANQQALSQYYADQEAEKARQAQLQAQREQQAAQERANQLLMQAYSNGNTTSNTSSYNKNNVTFDQWLSDPTYGAVNSINFTSNMSDYDKAKMLQSNYNLYKQNPQLYELFGGLAAQNLMSAYNKWRNS